MLGFSSAVITLNGEELKLGGGLVVFNNYENSQHLGNTKAVKVLKRMLNF